MSKKVTESTPQKVGKLKKGTGEKPVLLDLAGIERGLSENFLKKTNGVAVEEFKGPNHTSGDEPESLLVVGDAEQEIKENGKNKPRRVSDKKEGDIPADVKKATIPAKIGQSNKRAVDKFEEKFSKNLVVDPETLEKAQNTFYKSLTKKIGPVHETEEERASELEELISFVKEHRNKMVKELEKHTGGFDAQEIEKKIGKAEKRISILDRARQAFLGEIELSKEEWAEAKKTKDEVLKRIAEVENISPEAVEETEGVSFYGPMKYLKQHLEFLQKQKKSLEKKKNPNEEKISALESQIAGTSWRIEALEKVHKNADADPEDITRAASVEKEVLERIAENKAKKITPEITQNTEAKVEQPSQPKSQIKIDTKPQAVIQEGNKVEEKNVPSGPSKEFSRPLKSSYEKALERSEKNKSEPATKKNYEIPVTQNENVLSSKEEIAGTEKAIASANTFDELLSVIEKIDGIQGTQKWFSKYALMGRINLVRAKEITTDYIPTSAGLRDKIGQLLEAEGSLIYKPLGFSNPINKNVSTEKIMENEEKKRTEEKTSENVAENAVKTVESEPLKTINNETNEQEDDLRKGAENIFNDRIEEILSEITPLRVAYGKQIKIKTQHEHNQTRIGGLMTRLFRPFSRKESSNEVDFGKSKKEYNTALDNLKNVLNDESLNSEALKMAVELGDRGLEIILEVKLKIFEQLTKTLLNEAQLIEDLKTEGLPEGHKKIKSRLEQLAKDYRKKGGKIIPDSKSDENIIGDNLESHA